MRLAVLALLIVFAGCGKAPAIDPAFAPYAMRFVAAGMNSGRAIDLSGISIRFGDTAAESVTLSEANIAGYCEFSTKVITITDNPKIFDWVKVSDSEREELIFHELGHCALGRAHTAALRPGTNEPASIMTPDLIGSLPVYSEYHAGYIEELFLGK